MGSKVQAVDLKTPEEIIDVTFDFTDSLEVGETVQSAVVSVSLRKGTDTIPSAILSGSPTVQTPFVVQRVINGVTGCQYNVKCLATTAGTGAGRKYELIAVLPVRSLA